MNLELRNITGGYLKGQNIIHNISLTISPYESVSIIGQNGAGKSSLVKVILGMLPFSIGEIFYRNENISNKETIEIIKSGVGFFMQGGEVFPHLTAYENLLLAGNGFNRKEIENRIEKLSDFITFLKSVDLKKEASYLSGGERHQLALAMVLIRNPSLLILDEPSAGLSPMWINDIYLILKKLKERERLTIILIEQNITSAIEFSERVILMKNGEIEFDLKTSEVRENNELSRLFF